MYKYQKISSPFVSVGENISITQYLKTPQSLNHGLTNDDITILTANMAPLTRYFQIDMTPSQEFVSQNNINQPGWGRGGGGGWG